MNPRAAEHSDVAPADRPIRLPFTSNDQRFLWWGAGILFVALGGFLGLHAMFAPLIDMDKAPFRPVEFRVDVNKAGPGELVCLPGIGPTLASRIVSWRAANGEFGSHDELDEVKGIGPGKLAAIKPFLASIETKPKPAVATLDFLGDVPQNDSQQLSR